MSEDRVSIDVASVFDETFALRSRAAKPPHVPTGPVPDMHHAGLTESIGTLTGLARLLVDREAMAMATIARAVEASAIDVFLADSRDRAPA